MLINEIIGLFEFLTLYNLLIRQTRQNCVLRINEFFNCERFFVTNKIDTFKIVLILIEHNRLPRQN